MSLCDWSSDVCSSDLVQGMTVRTAATTMTLLRVSVMVVAAVLTVIPWTVRNLLTVHAFVPVSTEVGYTLRSEERRVGKECTSRWWAADSKLTHNMSIF